MILNLENTTDTVDHFERHGQLYIHRHHYEIHFDDQPQVAELADQYSDKLLSKLPADKYFYPRIPGNRLHMTLQEASRQDGVPGQYSEDQMTERDAAIQEVLEDLSGLELEIGKHAFLGDDGLLLVVDPADEIKRLRNEIRRILEMPPSDSLIPHVTLAYSKECDDVSEIYRVAEEIDDLPSAKVSVGALMRIAQWSNGKYYDWKDEDRKALQFGKVPIVQ